MLALSASGAGVGFVAGLGLALALALHLLVFGASAARIAAPPAFVRVVLTFGVIAALGAAAAPQWAWSAQAMEAGLFVATASAASLCLSALAGRAPSLRDEDW
jgi:hypothetical protein